MRAVTPGPGAERRSLRVLCLGAHADDIEIGCGGTLLELLGQYPGSACRWVVFSASGEREQEARTSAARFLTEAAEHRVDTHQVSDGHFPVSLAQIKQVLEDVKREYVADLIFTHYRDDRHQDHRTISDATWQTYRDHLILEYEIPKYDGDLGQPNCFVPLSPATRKRKLEYLLEGFPSQRSKRWFTEDTFLALLRLRGIECAAPSGYAEGFYARKLVLA
jgi:LmbE family N-acetylglucosaminyl deacetylase